MTRGFSRYLPYVSLVLILAAAIGGCGSGGSASIALVKKPRGEAEELAAHLLLGTSVRTALGELGRPDKRVEEGKTEALIYGSWYLEFEKDRLARKSTQRFPRGGVRPKSNFERVVLGLKLGEAIQRVRPKLGRPERIIETWEGDGERVTVLGFGGWQMTFVNGRLEQRTKS